MASLPNYKGLPPLQKSSYLFHCYLYSSLRRKTIVVDFPPLKALPQPTPYVNHCSLINVGRISLFNSTPCFPYLLQTAVTNPHL